MDDALGNALVVEVGDLLAEDEVLSRVVTRIRAANLVVGNGNALRGQRPGLGWPAGGFAPLPVVFRLAAACLAGFFFAMGSSTSRVRRP
jgi:hypothetical protein